MSRNVGKGACTLRRHLFYLIFPIFAATRKRGVFWSKIRNSIRHYEDMKFRNLNMYVTTITVHELRDNFKISANYDSHPWPKSGS